MAKTFASRYEVTNKLGGGSFGTVYAARDIRLERAIAVKVLHAPAGQKIAEARFSREAKALGKIQHPGVVPIYDFGVEDGEFWLVMPLFQRGSLDDQMKGLKNSQTFLPEIEVDRYVKSLLAALAAAHTQGVVHRDLKPANILLDLYSSPVICDFGLAKFVDPNLLQETLTASTELIGSPYYMSPEQWEARRAEHRPQTDLYSLGCIIFELFTNRRVFPGTTLEQIRNKHLAEQPPLLNEHRSDISPVWSILVSNLLSKEVESRHQSAAQILEILGTFEIERQRGIAVRHANELAELEKRVEASQRREEAVLEELRTAEVTQAAKISRAIELEHHSIQHLIAIERRRYANAIPFGYWRSSLKLLEIDSPSITINEGSSAGAVLVLGGISWRWCPPAEFFSERPNFGGITDIQKVSLRCGYWLAATELTQMHWVCLMGYNPSHFTGTELPVERVSWTEAQRWCDLANSVVNHPGWKVALPTEAQWEHGCRAGTTSPWNTGNRISKSHANFDGSAPKPVGQYEPNAWGLYDMHGNVWEWCQDSYRQEPGADSADNCEAEETEKIYRGGCWRYPAEICTSAYRNWANSSEKSQYLGFRPAIVPV